MIAYIARSTLWTGSRFRQARTVANDVSQRDCTQPAQRMIVELNRIIANCDSGLTTGPHESQDPEDQPNEGVGQVPQFAEKRQKLHSVHPCGDPDICNASCLKPCRVLMLKAEPRVFVSLAKISLNSKSEVGRPLAEADFDSLIEIKRAVTQWLESTEMQERALQRLETQSGLKGKALDHRVRGLRVEVPNRPDLTCSPSGSSKPGHRGS